MTKIKRGFLAVIGQSILVLFVIYILGSFSFIERIGNLVNDTFTYRLQYSQNRHSDDIVIIKIDDRTLDGLGKSDLGIIAFDKGVYAELIEKVFTTYKASVLGADIIFANPSVLGVPDEQKLASVFEKYEDKLVIATRSDYKPHPLCLYSNVQHGAIDTIAQDKVRTFMTGHFDYDIASRCQGFDVYEGNKQTISTYAREVLEKYSQNIDPFTREKIEKKLEIFEKKALGSTYLDYYSNGRVNEDTFGYQSYSFIDIFSGENTTPDGETIDLDGKIVLLGEVGTLIHDSHFTPVHQSIKMPGVEINANMITTLQQGRDIKDISHILMLAIYLFFFAFIILSTLYLRIRGAIGVIIASMIIIVLTGGWLFVIGYIFNIFIGIIGCIISLLCASIYKFQVTDKDKRILKKQFSSYVSPEVVDEISKNPNSVLVRGETREMTIFFSDIEGFTGISERNDAQIIVKMLNEYFAEMTKIIYQNKGTLDKYIGDAVMCFFNAPLKQNNHSYYACISALQQQKILKKLNILWKEKGYPEIKIRIGIHTGEAIHGNIGSSDTRVNYTVIGDSVNLASRIEGVGKQYGVYICVSDEVYELQKDAFYFRELDVIRVKGREKPVRIYELINERLHPLSSNSIKYLDRYARALEIYRSGDYAAARSIFLENVGDKTSSIMGKRCETLLLGQAELNQGVFDMLSK